MHLFGLGLHILIAALFAVHAVRSGQDRYWLFVLFMFPGIGSLVYAVAVFLPGLRHSRGARRVVGGVRRALDPGRELREAQDAFDVSATADNRLRLADALLEADRPGDAAEQLRAALQNVHSDDPEIRIRLARALLESGDAAQARIELESLRREHPQFRSSDGHLIYARAVAALDDRDQAREEFDALVGYYAGFEPRARYAELLLGWGEREAAQRLAQESIAHAKRLPRYARDMNRDWIARIEKVARATAG